MFQILSHGKIMNEGNFRIAKDIITSYEMRINVVKTIVEDTQRLLEEFKKKREKMSQELKEALAKHESLRKKDFDKMMEDILIAQSKREENVKQMLADFQEQEMTVIDNLKEMLEKGENLKLKDFKKTLVKIRKNGDEHQNEAPNRIKKELSQMQSEVHKMLENFKKEREKMASEWKNVVTLMAQKRKVNQKIIKN